MVTLVTVTIFRARHQGRHSTGIVPAQFYKNIAARNTLLINRLTIKAARAAMFFRFCNNMYVIEMPSIPHSDTMHKPYISHLRLMKMPSI